MSDRMALCLLLQHHQANCRLSYRQLAEALRPRGIHLSHMGVYNIVNQAEGISPARLRALAAVWELDADQERRLLQAAGYVVELRAAP